MILGSSALPAGNAGESPKPPEAGASTAAAARLLESEDDKKAWHEISEGAIAGQMHQCYWWADPLKKTGVRANGIGIWRGSRLVGGGLFRSIPVPYIGAHLTQCLAGPLHLDWHPDWADHFVSRIDELARADNSIEVAIHGCTNREAHRDITHAFLRRGLKITVTPGVTEAVLSLEGTTLEKIWKGMIKGTRENIKKAQKNGIQIRELTSSLELRSAHDAWLATAQRKDFSDIRPWNLLEPVLRHCIDNGMGTVYASFMDDKLLAAIFVSFIGGQASYVYGGYMDGSEKYYPNHILHFEAIRHCFERGIKAYNFGNLMPDYKVARSGTDQFKLGFGALPKQKFDSIIWKRKPLLMSCIDWLRARRAGKKLAEEFRRRLFSK